MSRGFSAAKLCRRKLYVGELVFVSPRPQVPVTWGLAYRKGLSPEDPNATATPSRAFLAARDTALADVSRLLAKTRRTSETL